MREATSLGPSWTCSSSCPDTRRDTASTAWISTTRRCRGERSVLLAGTVTSSRASGNRCRLLSCEVSRNGLAVAAIFEEDALVVAREYGFNYEVHVYNFFLKVVWRNVSLQISKKKKRGCTERLIKKLLVLGDRKSCFA